MPNEIAYIIWGFVLSLAIGRICIPSIIIVSKKKRLIDIPNERKVHTALIPRLGGISFFPALVISYTFIKGIFWASNGFAAIESPIFIRDLLFFTCGLMIIFATGLSDDIAGLSYRRKFLLQFIAAAIMVIPTGYINNLYGLFGIHQIPAILGIPLTIIIVIGIINAYNLIDGVDGLCSGLSSLVFITSGVFFYINGNFGIALLATCTLGVVFAFFMYNVFGKRLKIFMGDGGSLTLGYIISFFCLQFITKPEISFEIPSGETLMIAMGLIFIPLFDTTRVFASRIYRGVSPFYPDKTHIHHKVLRLGFTHLQSTLILLCIQAIYILANILLTPYLNINIMFIINMGSGILLIYVLNRIYKHKSDKAIKA